MKLGQNFLIDKNIADKIVGLAALDTTSRVVEIGPGRGILTERILEKIEKLTAIEIDESLTENLKAKFKSEIEANRLILIHNDVLQVNWDHFRGPLIIISNLPYQITSPILFLLQGLGATVERMILMMQKEVGDRLLAKPCTKDYGAITIFLQNDFEITKLFKVPPSVFSPRPKVDSIVLKLNRRSKPLLNISDDDFFKRVVKGAFGTRRKTLKNALKHAGILLSEKEATNLKTTTGIDPVRRGETLTISEFHALYAYIKQSKQIFLPSLAP